MQLPPPELFDGVIKMLQDIRDNGEKVIPKYLAPDLEEDGNCIRSISNHKAGLTCFLFALTETSQKKLYAFVSDPDLREEKVPDNAL
jgi:hypothetical protein